MKRSLSRVALAAGMLFATVNQAAAAPENGQAEQPAVEEENEGPAPAYTPFNELTGIQVFQTGGLRYTVGPQPRGGFGFSVVEVERLHNGILARYDTASGDITYLAPSGERVTFTAADEVPGQSTPQARLFFKQDAAGGVLGGSLTTPIVQSVPLSYTRFGTFFTSGPGVPLDGHAFVLGEHTRAGDLPKQGTASYTSSVGGSAIVLGAPAPHNLAGSTATFSADFATGAITTGIDLVATPVFGGAPIVLDTVSGIGSISRLKPGFAGLFTGSGLVKGSFSGAFFGPKAVEFGYDFVVGGTSSAGRSFTAIGGVAGSTAIAPPPPPVYIPFADLTGSQGFASAGVGYGIGPVPSGGFGFQLKGFETLGSGVAVQLDTATGAIIFVAPTGLSTIFTAADVVQSTPNQVIYNKPNPAGGVFGGSFTTPSINGVPLSYTRFATFFANQTPTGFEGHAFVFGVQTRANDVPTTGTATYTGGAGGSAILASGASVPLTGAVSLTADFSTGSIATVLNLLLAPPGGAQTPLDTLTGSGSLGGLGSVKPGFAGSLTGSGTVGGNFVGAFFGPQAVEFGYDFLAGGVNAQGLGFTAVGGAVGTKQ